LLGGAARILACLAGVLAAQAAAADCPADEALIVGRLAGTSERLFDTGAGRALDPTAGLAAQLADATCWGDLYRRTADRVLAGAGGEVALRRWLVLLLAAELGNDAAVLEAAADDAPETLRRAGAALAAIGADRPVLLAVFCRRLLRRGALDRPGLCDDHPDRMMPPGSRPVDGGGR
jgi:hypothetical protein